MPSSDCSFTKPGNCHLLSEEKINLLSDCACMIYNIIIFYTVCASTYKLKIISVIFNLPFVAYEVGRDLIHVYVSVNKKKTTDGPKI